MAENKLIIGNIEITGIQNITAGNQELSTSLLNDVLEIDTLDCDFNSEDSSLNILSCIGEKVTYYHGDQQRQILYVESIKRTGPKSYHIYAVSAVSKLDTIPHSGGIYTGQTALEVISEICGPIPVIVKSNLRNIQLYGWLPYCQPPNSSARDNLNQVLFAIGASLGTDLNGVLRIETLWDGTTGAIELQRTDLNGSVTDVQKVSIVSVTEHQYTEGQEEQDLFEGTAQEGDTIVFNEPMHTLTASGFTILESGANYAKLSAGSGILTGKKYIHNKRVIARTVTENIPENEKSKENATLVSLINSNAIADRLARYYKCNKTIQSSFITEYERPGQIVNIMDPYDQEIVSACIASMNVNMSGVLKADAELLVGFVPPKFEQVVTYDEHEVLTGSGTWTVPEGVTQVVVVLIGGGGAGGNGDDGTGDFYGGFGEDKYDNQTISIYTSDSAGQTKTGTASISSSGHTTEAGVGGSGGKAGEPGKVYQKTINVSAGDTISYICGSGGQTNGASGEDTVFGEESSASGSAESAGYTDIVTGITYAKSGIPGSAGADGGTAGNNGGDAGEIAGGTGRPSYSNQKNGSDGGSYANYTSTYSVNASVSSSGSGGGGAGGSSGSNNGSAGSSSTAPSFGFSSQIAEGTFRSSKPGAGGKGADGASAVLYGCGGDGGGGGGGGGAAGNYNLTVRNNASIKITSTPSSTIRIRFSAHVKTYDNYSGSGGAGGAGGAGGDGCIILYYGAQKKIESGPVMDRTGRFILDKLGRRFVV